MTGLRDRKKQQVRTNILTAAQEIFLQDGYANTTIKKIAERCEIGVGTVYNYFASKGELFLAIFFDAMPEYLAEGQRVLDQAEQYDPVSGTLELLTIYTRPFEDYPKALWREIMGVSFGNIEESKLILSGFMDLDTRFLEQMTALIERYRERGMLPPDFQVAVAAECIYGSLMMLFMRYFYMEEYTMEQAFEGFRQTLDFLFRDRRPSEER
ncbi:MAG TPA: TetR/AcrR family transcriptional regulator [Bacilli bacterium]|nr:TetR/AcrR family transcriptional regulator [Bacilli bacterium]